MTEITRHFTATTFIVHQDKVLLHDHPKQHLWLPPGGHIERDELPHDAAVREVEEETGLRVQLHSATEARELAELMDCAVVPQPAFILIETINPFHEHVDFTYFARCDKPAMEDGATDQPVWRRNAFSWFTAEELTMENVPANVRQAARLAIDYFASTPPDAACNNT
ncbi:MAG: NUDIX hydrolase [Chloroflexota bacterium]